MYPVMLTVAFAFAAQIGFAAEDDRPCVAEIKKFCADIEPGGGRLAACMQKHQAELSPACQARGQQVRERVQEAHEACQDDVAKYCKDIKPGEGRIVACLRTHEKDVSSACKTAMRPAR
jgi:peptide subunit release factor 1 (eRF1)